jgi:signal transduction histidine kinase
VTGICVTETDSWTPYASFPHIRDVFLVPQAEIGITILRRPSWWTPKRLLIALAALLALTLGILVWNISLHRLAERRGKELAEESIARAETDMKVLERTRLAVELHDSVAQNLTGVAMELEAARQYQDGAPTELLNHMGIAWRTLKSCRDELRNCLWDLRNNALEETDMETAIRKTLLPHIKGIELVLRFKVPRQMLSDNTTHAMLRVIRELALNGIRHGKAKTIRIAGDIDGNTLKFSVSDDGCGFDPENCPSVDDGHFGLQGIRERVAQLGGTVSISSEPGKGTKTTVTIDSHEKDQRTDN